MPTKIIAGHTNPIHFDDPDFGLLDDYAENGVYVEPSESIMFDIRAAVKRVQELGRPLTDDEFREFVY